MFSLDPHPEKRAAQIRERARRSVIGGQIEFASPKHTLPYYRHAQTDRTDINGFRALFFCRGVFFFSCLIIGCICIFHPGQGVLATRQMSTVRREDENTKSIKNVFTNSCTRIYEPVLLRVLACKENNAKDSMDRKQITGYQYVFTRPNIKTNTTIKYRVGEFSKFYIRRILTLLSILTTVWLRLFYSFFSHPRRPRTSTGNHAPSFTNVAVLSEGISDPVGAPSRGSYYVFRCI